MRTIVITKLRDGKYSFVENAECQKRRIAEPFDLNDIGASVKMSLLFNAARTIGREYRLRYDETDQNLKAWLNYYENSNEKL